MVKRQRRSLRFSLRSFVRSFVQASPSIRVRRKFQDSVAGRRSASAAVLRVGRRACDPGTGDDFDIRIGRLGAALIFLFLGLDLRAVLVRRSRRRQERGSHRREHGRVSRRRTRRRRRRRGCPCRMPPLQRQRGCCGFLRFARGRSVLVGCLLSAESVPSCLLPELGPDVVAGFLLDERQEGLEQRVAVCSGERDRDSVTDDAEPLVADQVARESARERLGARRKLF